MRTLTASITALAFFLTTLAASRAWAQAPNDQEVMTQAKAHFEAGKGAYLNKDYTGAIREFKAAQTLRPSPILDYNIGLAYEGLGKPRAATKYYRRYLEGKPDAPNRAEVEQKIAVLDQQAAAVPPPAAG